MSEAGRGCDDCHDNGCGACMPGSTAYQPLTDKADQPTDTGSSDE